MHNPRNCITHTVACKYLFCLTAAEFTVTSQAFSFLDYCFLLHGVWVCSGVGHYLLYCGLVCHPTWLGICLRIWGLGSRRRTPSAVRDALPQPPKRRWPSPCSGLHLQEKCQHSSYLQNRRLPYWL
jgi:hypothetical protein